MERMKAWELSKIECVCVCVNLRKHKIAASFVSFALKTDDWERHNLWFVTDLNFSLIQ